MILKIKSTSPELTLCAEADIIQVIKLDVTKVISDYKTEHPYAKGYALIDPIFKYISDQGYLSLNGIICYTDFYDSIRFDDVSQVFLVSLQTDGETKGSFLLDASGRTDCSISLMNSQGILISNYNGYK